MPSVARVEILTVEASEGRPVVGRALVDGALGQASASMAEAPHAEGCLGPYLLKKASISSGYLGATPRFLSLYPSLLLLKLEDLHLLLALVCHS